MNASRPPRNGHTVLDTRDVDIDIPLSGLAVANPSSTRPLVTGPGSAQVFMPGERGDLRWSAETRQLCVMMEQDALEQELAALLRDEVARPLTFGPDMDLRGSAGGTWRHVIALL